MADRYTVRTRETRGGTGGRGGQVKITVWVVLDTNTMRVARDTKGFEGTGGYHTEREARTVANRMNRELTRALREKAQREKRRRAE